MQENSVHTLQKPNPIILFCPVVAVDSTSRFHMKRPSRMSVMTEIFCDSCTLVHPYRVRIFPSFLLRALILVITTPVPVPVVTRPALQQIYLFFHQRKLRQESLIHDPPGHRTKPISGRQNSLVPVCTRFLRIASDGCGRGPHRR